MRYGLFITAMILSSLLYAAPDYYREQLQQRISPIGKVHIKEEVLPLEPQPREKSELVTTEEKKSPGRLVYETYCSVCHQQGVAGAPKFRHPGDWQTRLADKKIEGLTRSAIKGINAMPAKGTCSTCNEADIRAAVEYMVSP